jgi:ketosteroid isomerase-like protein
METETDEFLTEVLHEQQAAEVAFRNGNAEPRLALWSGREPVSWLGQYGGCAIGTADVSEHFGRVATRFTDLHEFGFELIAADVHGDTAYTVGFEHFLGSFDGRPSTVMTHRVSRVYRREDSHWRIAHGHGDVAPWATRRPPQT